VINALRFSSFLSCFPVADFRVFESVNIPPAPIWISRHSSLAGQRIDIPPAQKRTLFVFSRSSSRPDTS